MIQNQVICVNHSKQLVIQNIKTTQQLLHTTIVFNLTSSYVFYLLS